MKKFLAVLLAVALLGVAGAAFADEDATHASHLKNDDIKETLTTPGVDAVKKALGSNAASFDVTGLSDSELNNLIDEYKAQNQVVVYVLPKMTAKSIDQASLTGLDPFNSLLVGKALSGKAVTVAAASTATFVDGEGTALSKVPSGNVNINLANLEDGKTYQTVGLMSFSEYSKSPEGPTSNKGSGGCNGGFASIAVLVLGALALRRKAR